MNSTLKKVLVAGSILSIGGILYYLYSNKKSISAIEEKVNKSVEEAKDIQAEVKEDLLQTAMVKDTKAEIKEEILEYEKQIKLLENQMRQPYYLRMHQFHPTLIKLQSEITRLKTLVKNLKFELI